MSLAPILVVALAIVLTHVAPASARAAAPLDGESGSSQAFEEGQDELPSSKSPREGPPAPLGVRFPDPLEGEERFRLSYRFERIKRQGLLVSTRDISRQQVLNDLFIPYSTAPRSMNVTGHHFRFAYAPHPRVTLVVDVPFYEKELVRVDANDRRFQDESEGVGDLGFAVIVPFIRKGRESSHFHLGFNAPTGSIRRGGSTGRLGYDMQIGNGSWDLEWGWTYRGSIDWLSWGGQAYGQHPVGTNGRHYREGSRFEASIWSVTRIFRGLSGSLRFEWEKQNNTRGRERAFDPIQDPTENSKIRGGTTLTVAPGLSLELRQLPGQRLSLELGVPVHQDVDGPQLERDWTLEVGWQWDF